MRHGFFVHPSQETGSTEMASLTNQASRRGSPMVHGCASKGARILVAIRAFIARQSSQRRRDMIARLDCDADIARIVTSLASGRTDVIEACYRSPGCLGMAGIATGCRRHVVRWLVIHPRITDQMTRCA